MQITSGLVTVASGSSTVTGNSGADWSNVRQNCLFILSGSVYTINTVNLTGTLPIIGISPSYQGTNVTDVAYTIVTDFTPNQDIPLLNPGDLESAAIFSRAMKKLDAAVSAMGTGEPTVTDITLTKTAHGFSRGNALTRSASSGWVHAHSGSSDDASIIGFVVTVPTEDTFVLRTQGRIDNIDGATLVDGHIYYLRSGDYTGTGSRVVGSGVGLGSPVINFREGTTSDTGLTVPLFQADSDHSGFILSLATAQMATFGVSQNGLVPGPTSATGTHFLCDDGTWKASTVDLSGLTSAQATQADAIAALQSGVTNGPYNRVTFTPANTSGLLLMTDAANVLGAGVEWDGGIAGLPELMLVSMYADFPTLGAVGRTGTVIDHFYIGLRLWVRTKKLVGGSWDIYATKYAVRVLRTGSIAANGHGGVYLDRYNGSAWQNIAAMPLVVSSTDPDVGGLGGNYGAVYDVWNTKRLNASPREVEQIEVLNPTYDQVAALVSSSLAIPSWRPPVPANSLYNWTCGGIVFEFGTTVNPRAF